MIECFPNWWPSRDLKKENILPPVTSVPLFYLTYLKGRGRVISETKMEQGMTEEVLGIAMEHAVKKLRRRIIFIYKLIEKKIMFIKINLHEI